MQNANGILNISNIKKACTAAEKGGKKKQVF